MPVNRIFRLHFCWTAIVLLTSGVCVNGQSSFQGLGVINPSPGSTNVVPGSAAGGISPDGSTVFGSSLGFQVYYGRESIEAFRWTADTGMVPLGFLIPGPATTYPSSGANGENAFHIVGMSRIYFSNNSPVVWNGPNNITPVTWPSGYPQDVGGHSLSWLTFARNSPAIAAAFSTNHKPGFYWASPGATPIQMFPPAGAPANAACLPLGMSSDGTAIYGQLTAPSYAGGIFSWSTTGGSTLINIPVVHQGLGLGRSHPDTSVVIGRVVTNLGPGFRTHAFRIMNGAFSIIPSVSGPAGFTTYEEANYCAPDGSVIVGRAAFPGLGVRGAIYTDATGWLDFETYMTTTLGLNLTGWSSFGNFAGLSDDGTVIVGTATHNGLQEAFRAVIPPLNVDTDGDGLFDDWEINGIPYTDSFGNLQRYLLDINGDGISDSNPMHKDMFIEIDAMNDPGIAPTMAELLPVVQAFAGAPAELVNNPDLLPGVTLHLQLDETNIPTFDFPNGFVQFDQVKLTAETGTTIPGRFGTASERTGPDAAAIREAKKKAFRYCVFAKSHSGGSSSGQGELPGNDFMVTLGLWDPAGGTADQKAGTFMHELGHTLGLGHGGRDPNTGLPDNTHYKPNYYSIMNYLWQVPEPWMSPGSWPLSPGRVGFSQVQLIDLNESALLEPQGLGAAPGTLNGNVVQHNGNADPKEPVNVVNAAMCCAIDWNADGEVTYGGETVQADLNHLFDSDVASPGQMLFGREDWSQIVYKFRDLSTYADGVHFTGVGPEQEELTYELHVAISKLAPPFCMGDINLDQVVNVNDLLAVINAWGPCGNCTADIAPNGATDGVVNVSDLLTVINGWGPCP